MQLCQSRFCLLICSCTDWSRGQHKKCPRPGMQTEYRGEVWQKKKSNSPTRDGKYSGKWDWDGTSAASQVGTLRSNQEGAGNYWEGERVTTGSEKSFGQLTALRNYFRAGAGGPPPSSQFSSQACCVGAASLVCTEPQEKV